MNNSVRSSSAATVFFVMFVLDIFAIAFAAILAAYLYPGVNDLAYAWELFWERLHIFAIIFMIWIAVGWTQGMFISHRRESMLRQFYDVTKAVVITLLFAYFIVDLTARHQMDRRYAVTFIVVAYCAITSCRMLLCLALWIIRQHGFNPRYVLVVGANERTAGLLKIITAHARFGYKVIGIVDNDSKRMKLLEAFGVPYLGPCDDIELIMGEHVIDEVHVCLPVRSCHELIQHLADVCLGIGVSMRMVADLFPLQLATSRVHDLEGIPMLSLTMVSENTPQLALKRAIDMGVSALLLILLAPFLLCVALSIKVSSKGPVLFYQERVGLNSRRFYMIKFRSMVLDAEAQREKLAHHNEVDGPIFKIFDDPRITPLGKWLRRYSVDELPQLVNVLKGEMSLVGPRPHPTQEVEAYSWHHRRRLSVKPGITGLAQVSGRSGLAWGKCVDLDLRYIDTWSLFNDLRILLRTLHAVICAKGAA